MKLKAHSSIGSGLDMDISHPHYNQSFFFFFFGYLIHVRSSFVGTLDLTCTRSKLLNEVI